MIEAKVVADSISEAGARVITLQLKYPRFIHAEFMTHRMFSRNASSSRAIPVRKVLSQVWKDPAMPIHWGENKAGMQARTELMGFKLKVAKFLWKSASKLAAIVAYSMMQLNLHKQVVNRILEPFQYIHVIVTATEWDNFFNLRAHPDAQPEIQALAYEMLHAIKKSTPKKLTVLEWHLPYVTDEEWENAVWTNQWEVALKLSAARCARVSYLKHDGSKPSIGEDLKLYSRLIESHPMHASPIEHQAQPSTNPDSWSGNFKGWIQYRKLVENRQ